MKYIFFFPNDLGQKRTGIKETVKLIYDQYFYNIYNNSYFISCDNSLENNLLKLYKKNMEVFNNNSDRIINIGGDHSMAIASLGASLNTYGSKLKVLWFDAHGDINTRQSSSTGNYHGMPLSFLTGLDNSPDFDYIKNKLIFNNLCYIGIRDLDPEEINIIKLYNIKNIKSDEFNNFINKYIKDIIEWVGDSPLHLSFDVDSLDPKYMEYTGTRAHNGLQLDKVLICLKKICKEINIVNIDLTELNLFNPDLNPCNFEKQLCSLNVFLSIFNVIYDNIN